MEIGDQIKIIVSRTESNFDRACNEAYKTAIMRFGIDENGHSDRIKRWERSSCWIDVIFSTYKRSGNDHVYLFFASAEKAE